MQRGLDTAQVGGGTWDCPQTPLSRAVTDTAQVPLLVGPGPHPDFIAERGALLMSLYPCSVCHTRGPGKLASVTTAWNRADGTRAAWRQRLCTACFARVILAMPEQAYDAPLTCPACGIGTADDMTPIFCTVFIPSQGRFDYEWPFCPPCAASWQIGVQDGGTLLEDRRDTFGGLGPGPQTNLPDSAPASWSEVLRGLGRL